MSFKIVLQVVKQIGKIGGKTMFSKEISLFKVVLKILEYSRKCIGRLFAGETK